MKRTAETIQRTQRWAPGFVRVMPVASRLHSLALSSSLLNRYAPRGIAAV